MSTATAEPQAVNTEVKVFKPSDSLVKLAENIKTVAKFDPGIVPIFEQATRIAAVNQLLAAPEMANILDKLEGSPAGFPTDIASKDQKYPVKERNQAVTQGLSMGARLVGGEFMIIKGRAFLGKPYYRRMLDELGTPGTFTESCKYRMLWWDTEVGDIALNGPIASCPVTITYKIEDKATGKELSPLPFTRKFSIRTFPTDTPDLWTGKFERRAWKKLLEFLAGVDFGEEGDEGGAAAPTASALPPTGTVSLAREAAPAAAPAPAGSGTTPAPAAEDAAFTPVAPTPHEEAKAVGQYLKPVAPAAPAPSNPPKPTQKAYADMSQKERAAYIKENGVPGATPGQPPTAPVPEKMDVKLGNATIPNARPEGFTDETIRASMPPPTPATPPPQEPPAGMPSGTPELF